MKRGVRVMADKRIVIIAGPNGAGKTTFALEFLPNEADCPVFVNADLIAAGLSPFAPDLAALKAGRLMLEAIAEHAAKGESFAFETTLSGRTYARRISRWQAAGYRVSSIFLALPSPEFAIARVKERVHQGGHDVPEIETRRCFDAGLRNFQNVYRDLVDAWSYYDNSGRKSVLVNWGEKI
jgi:predicted ABC-type ATPase